jgi:hypothetical protein
MLLAPPDVLLTLAPHGTISPVSSGLSWGSSSPFHFTADIIMRTIEAAFESDCIKGKTLLQQSRRRKPGAIASRQVLCERR